MQHPAQLGCKSCQKARQKFHASSSDGTMTEERALAAYTFGTSCRDHNDAACAAAVMLADDAYWWLYSRVSMA
jgi:hypothetical protein